MTEGGVSIKLNGERDCIAAFDDIRVFVKGNLFRQSLRAAGDIMLQELYSRAPVGDPATDKHSGKLVSNLRLVVSKRGESYHARIIINMIGSAANAANAFYWRMVEFGHTANGTVVPPNPFVTSAFESKNVQSAQQVIDSFNAGLDRAQAIAQRAGLR
jgi:HK97 gp10 family phage protein